MGDVHTMPTGRDAARRLLERILVQAIETCPDQRVAERWASLARATAPKYIAPPHPTHHLLEFKGVADLDVGSKRCVADAAAAWMESYFDDVRGRMMAMHGDLLAAQKRIAELEVRIEDLVDESPHSSS